MSTPATLVIRKDRRPCGDIDVSAIIGAGLAVRPLLRAESMRYLLTACIHFREAFFHERCFWLYPAHQAILWVRFRKEQRRV